MLDFNELTHAEKIKMFTNSAAYDKALELCNLRKFKDDPEVQSERLYILIYKLKDYERAYKVFMNAKHIKLPCIQIKGIRILKELKKYDELDKLIEENGDIDSIEYAFTLIRYYNSRNNREKALEVCNNPLYANNVDILAKKQKLLNKKEKIKNDLVCDTLIKLYADDITPEEISHLPISQFHKDVLTLAYYEKHNKKKGLEECKSYKRTPHYNREQIKILNGIYGRLISNKIKAFDITFYSRVLNRSFDLEEASIYMEDKKNKEDFKKIIESVSKKEEHPTIKVDNIANKETIEKTKKLERNMVGSVGINVNNRYSNNSNINTPIHTPTKTVPCIKDVLGDEIISLQKYIYCMMQDYSYYEDANNTWLEIKDIACKPITKKSKYTLDEEEKLEKGLNRMKEDYSYYDKTIEAWDTIEMLADKPITNKNAVHRLVDILLKTSKEHPEIIEVDSNKLTKMLNR